jgi:phosphate/sulfate permease
MEPWAFKVSLMMLLPLLALIFTYFLVTKIRRYLHKKKELDKMAVDYMSKLKCREELLMHFDWALSNGEKKIGLAKQIVEFDKELSDTYKQYMQVKCSDKNKY